MLLAKNANLKLNASKLEVLRTKQHKDPEKLDIAGIEISTTLLPSAWEFGGSITSQPLMLSMRTLTKPKKHSLPLVISVPFMETLPSLWTEHL